MKIYEYQAKNLFSSYGIPVDKYVLLKDAISSSSTYDDFAHEKVVIKAQVQTGGRGKAGGVKIADNKNDSIKYVNNIIGMDIKGFIVNKVIMSEAVNIQSEYYISFIVDRNTKSTVLMMSPEGGVDIEDVAKNNPDKIFRFPIDPFIGIPDYLARKFAFKLFDKAEYVNQFIPLVQNLYKLFVEKDASLVEINPLVITKEDKLMAIDAKMTFDDNALYRHPEILSLFEPTKEEKVEYNAKENGFSYVHLDGQIGCMVNGAGLAMATMDMIKLYGGNPANFLDIGGSSNPEKVIQAMNLLLKHPNLKVVLINIFGGITRCDDVATGLISAFEKIKTNIPVIVRLTGTNENEGRALLSGRQFHVAETMNEAVKIAVAMV